MCSWDTTEEDVSRFAAAVRASSEQSLNSSPAPAAR